MAKRIGANRRKAMAEQRKYKPRRARKFAGVFAVTLLIAAAGFAAYTYGSAVSTHITEAVKSNFKYNKELYTEYQIVNCGKNNESLLKAAIDSLLKFDSLSLKRDDVFKAALVIPEIERVNIRKTRDKRTLIKVIERTPVALVQDGSIWLVDKNGVRFAVMPGQYYDLPLLSFGGANLSDTVGLEMFNAIKKTARNLGNTFFKQISQIGFSDSGSISLIFKSGHTEYTIGSENIEERLARVKKVKERLQEENRDPARIDLRYRSLAVVSML
ncbi:MAG: cell division protein FtsQ [Chitinispirillales bacterium]|jgi:cell division septal protein FtsQ|nr:cell division protein FtsQ [Chitinispirillales bacterium]